MKIHLNNFRCHKDATFEIPDKGLVLLSGDSGRGKTTILNAVSYGLYGNIRKPYSHGTTSCCVDIEYKDMIVTRTNRPNRLVLKYKGCVYEDDAAQGIIDKEMGMNTLEYMASSYVLQGGHNSVITMAPSEQSRFVETLAFSDNSHKEYRKKFKESVISSREKLNQLKGRLYILEDQYRDRNSKLPDNPPDLKGILPEKIRSKQKKLKNKMKEVRSLILKLEEESKVLKEQENIKKEFEEERKRLEIELAQFKQMRSALGEIKTDEEIENIELKLEKSKKSLSQLQSFLKYENVITKAKKFKSQHEIELKEKINKIKNGKVVFPPLKTRNNLRKRLKKLETLRNAYHEENAINQLELEQRNLSIEKSKKILNDAKLMFPRGLARIKKRESLLSFLKKKEGVFQTNRKKITKQIDTLKATEKLYQNKYQCPSCKKDLYFKNNILVSTVPPKIDHGEIISDLIGEENKYVGELGIISRWILTLGKYIAIIEKGKPKKTIEFNPEEVKKLREQVSIFEKKEMQLDELTKKLKNGLPPSIEALFKEAKVLSKGYPKEFKLKFNVKELKQSIDKLSSVLNDVWHNKSEHSSISREINIREKKLTSIQKRLNKKSFLPRKKITRTFHDVQNEIYQSMEIITQLSTNLSKLQETLEIIHKYDAYKKEAEEVQQLKDHINKLQNDQSVAEDELEGALGLEEIGREAEILAMEETAKNINEHARPYLNTLFEDPITVKLLCHKRTLKGENKVKMNTYIEYRGEKYASVDELSGGEIQRCELAFILAINDMLNSNVLLLDECLNNLDSEINQDVLTFLRESNKKQRLTLVVSHEATTGVFDTVVKL